ncbi:E3 ubiquitin-protein ligase RNF216 [Curvularia clavata]|uniref:E3 ubiquitin-protein ligase RNF216 n=1 Tax=Curvularia clavata TaxID=95742 RepID=A0A9Q8Z1N1_CURCL|nr:E3 ubiquitin-protein ligase RNF216 [Curvularia clavata]
MAPSDLRASREIIVLSDSETENDGDGDTQLQALFEQDYTGTGEVTAEPHESFPVVDPEVIDLAAIPDVDVPPSDPPRLQPDGQDPGSSAQDHVITEFECLQTVLSVLPDISTAYALKFIQQRTANHTRTITRCEQLIAELLEGEPYPKEAKEKKRKRGGEDEDELSAYEKGERDPEIGDYEHDAIDSIELLKDEFPYVPVRYITTTIQQHKTIYKAYGTLEKQLRDYELIARSFTKITKSRNKRGIELQLIEKGSQLPKELHAAKKKIEIEAAERRKFQEAKDAEKANLDHARMNNQMGECACCFEDVPLNRMISCNGDTVHLYCKNCVCQQIETQMGQSCCRPKCFGVDGCDGTFSRGQLQDVLSEKTFERLEHMQQMEDLAAAGLDFLSECPFCDFKMECPPVEFDKEFRCQNPKCSKTSCRLCQKESHIPLSCEEFKKEGQITLRHVVEEAMSAALIRHCNRCKHPFIKEFGCNKMTCTHCRNMQCHFGEAQAGKCPLHENIEERHEQEVKRAAGEAMAKVRADNPGLSDADLMVKVSDQVKQAEEARRGQVQAEAHAFPYHMVEHQPQQPLHQAFQPRPAPQPGAVAAIQNLRQMAQLQAARGERAQERAHFAAYFHEAGPHVPRRELNLAARLQQAQENANRREQLRHRVTQENEQQMVRTRQQWTQHEQHLAHLMQRQDAVLERIHAQDAARRAQEAQQHAHQQLMAERKRRLAERTGRR